MFNTNERCKTYLNLSRKLNQAPDGAVESEEKERNVSKISKEINILKLPIYIAALRGRARTLFSGFNQHCIKPP